MSHWFSGLATGSVRYHLMSGLRYMVMAPSKQVRGALAWRQGEKGTAMAYAAIDVARWFVAWADDDPESEAQLTNLKLQKLLYYAQGHWLANHDEPLFADPIQAWAHGPVVPAVYHEFKHFGSGAIDAEQVLGDEFDWGDFADVDAHLVSVWNTYGQYAAWALRQRTHRESPWRDAFDEDARGTVISNEALKAHFASTRL